jgi:hypothetical protein
VQIGPRGETDQRLNSQTCNTQHDTVVSSFWSTKTQQTDGLTAGSATKWLLNCRVCNEFITEPSNLQRYRRNVESITTLLLNRLVYNKPVTELLSLRQSYCQTIECTTISSVNHRVYSKDTSEPPTLQQIHRWTIDSTKETSENRRVYNNFTTEPLSRTNSSLNCRIHNKDTGEPSSLQQLYYWTIAYNKANAEPSTLQ